MNAAYRAIMQARAVATWNLASALGLVQHAQTKGQLRELTLDELFRPLLPVDIGIGTGEIVSSTGEVSRQQDLVVYDRRILPPLMVGERMGVFPVESVAYAIEVKSRLDIADLTAANASAVHLDGFFHLPGFLGDDDVPINPQPAHRHPVYALLAFGTDLAAEPTVAARYDQFRGAGDPLVRAICVIGRGYWYWHQGQWKQDVVGGPLGELVAFVGHMMNTIPLVLKDRGAPRFGNYVL